MNPNYYEDNNMLKDNRRGWGGRGRGIKVI